MKSIFTATPALPARKFPGSIFAVAVVALTLAGAAHADAAPPALALHVNPSPVAATVQGAWALHIAIVNRSDYGCYVDSLVVDITPTPGAAGAGPRHMVMHSLATGSASAGDSTYFDMNVPAGREDAHLVFQLCVHTLNVKSITLRAEAQGLAYDPARLLPSEVVRVAGRDVELTRVVAGDATGGPGLLLIRDEGATGDADLLTAIEYLRSGYSVVVMSPPGTGRSSGPADMSGPASLAAAQAALDTLAHLPAVSPGRLAAWGKGHGGTLALLLAEHRPELRAVIAQGAPVDPWATYRSLPAQARAAFVAQAGRDSAGWKARSPLAGVATLSVPTLVLHGEQDLRAPAAAARELVAQLQTGQVPVDSKFFASAGDSLPAQESTRLVRRFLAAHMAAR